MRRHFKSASVRKTLIVQPPVYRVRLFIHERGFVSEKECGRPFGRIAGVKMGDASDEVKNLLYENPNMFRKIAVYMRADYHVMWDDPEDASL